MRLFQLFGASVVPLLVLSSSASALEREFSLAIYSPGALDVESIPLAKSLTIRVTNLAPGNRYQQGVGVDRKLIPPLDFNTTFVPTGIALLGPDPCADLETAAVALKQETSEVAVPGHLLTVGAEIEACAASGGGSAERERQLSESRRLLDSTERVIEVTDLGRDSEVTIVLTRLKSARADLAQWSVTFQTPPRGRFVTSYGLGVVHNKSEIFFSRRQNEGSYEVAEREPDGKYDPLGVVAFTWLMEGTNEVLGGDFGLTGGMGWTGENAGVFLGPSLTWGDNITLTLGLGLHPEQRADRRYRAGDDLPLALSEEDLNGQHYDFGAFFGITFRTGSKLERSKNNSPTATPQEKAAKLQILSSMPASVTKGAPFAVSITVSNQGNGTAKSVSAIAKIPTHTKIADGTDWVCDNGGGSGDICRLGLGDIPPGKAVSAVSLNLKVAVDAAGEIGIQPSAKGGNTDEVKATEVVKTSVQ